MLFTANEDPKMNTLYIPVSTYLTYCHVLFFLCFVSEQVIFEPVLPLTPKATLLSAQCVHQQG